MLLLFGMRARSKTIDEGTFYCSREGGDRPYQRKSSRRWFTVFFIPVLPLGELGEFIECASCGSTYFPSALDNPTSGEIHDATTIAIRHVVVAMLLADGEVDPNERSAALSVVARYASAPYRDDDLARDLAELSPDDLDGHLRELAMLMNEHGRENVLTSAVYLAGSDGTVDTVELALARSIGRTLTMSSAHIEGTVQQELARLGLSN